MAKHLPECDDVDNMSVLYLNSDGHFINPGDDRRYLKDGEVVAVNELPDFFRRKIALPDKVTDVFVFVHGWRNDDSSGLAAARKFFGGIRDIQKSNSSIYTRIANFIPAFVGVRWPSWSGLGPIGYAKVRDLAANLTGDGEAEYFLSSLLGYLEIKKETQESALPTESEKGVLQAKAGFYVHCFGHSFGGRFLTAAIAEAASPKPKKTLAFTSERYAYTVDSLIVFQMAAPSKKFHKQLEQLTDMERSPLLGPLYATFSKHDTANCLWHLLSEGEQGIGCAGVIEPSSRLGGTKLLSLSEDEQYSKKDYESSRIINVNANDTFAVKEIGGGAHGDIFYDDSVHLLLSVANFARKSNSE